MMRQPLPGALRAALFMSGIGSGPPPKRKPHKPPNPGRPLSQYVTPRMGAIGAATTQTTTNIVWTPSDAQAFATETDQLWQALDRAAVESSSKTGGLTGAELGNFQIDYVNWNVFFQRDSGALFTGSRFWWDTDTLSDYQSKAVAWFNLIQARSPDVTLPVLSQGVPPSGLLALIPSADAVKWGTIAVLAGGVAWFAWPWIAGARAMKTRKNPRRGRR